MTVSHIEPIPLRKLYLSDQNVRTTPATQEEEDQLEASIDTHGIRQNLQVLLTGDPDADESYGVIAGGRRLQALQRLADKGKIDPATYPVPCLLMGAEEEVAEISLAENVVRADMHPADQVVAFDELHKAGRTVEQIAERFGVTPVTVEKRLRLANVHPELLQAYRDEKLTLEALMAFTLSPDPDEQLACFKTVSGHYRLNPHSIRSALTEDKLHGGSAAVQFVGIEAYEAAGGTVTRDLFAQSDEAGVFIDCPQLLKKLAIEKLNEAAADMQQQAGWKWVEPMVEYDYNALSAFGRFAAPEPEPTAEEAAQLEAIEEKMGTLNEAYDDNEDDGGAEFDEDEYDRLERQHEAITDAIEQRTDFTPEQKAASGVMLYVSRDGGLRAEAGLIRADDEAAAQAVIDLGANGHAGNGHAGGMGNGPLGGSTVPPRTRTGKPANPEAVARKQAGYSQAVADDLKHIRTSLVKAELAKSPPVALDLLVFQMGRALLGNRIGYDRKALEGLSVARTATHPIPRSGDAEFAGNNPGEAELDEIEEALTQRHEPWLAVDSERTVEQCWQAFCQISEKDKQEVLAFCVAATLTNQLSIEAARSVEMEAAVERIGPPLADARLSAAVFWSRIPKKAILKAMAESGDAEWAGGFSGCKKAELAAHAEAIFRNPDSEVTLSDKAQDRIRTWTPPGFTAAPVSDEE